MQHERGLELAGVGHPTHVALADVVDERCGQLEVREPEDFGLGMVDPDRAHGVLDQRGVPAVTVQQQQRIQPVVERRLGDLLDRLAERSVLAGDRPAERPVMRGVAGPDRRREEQRNPIVGALRARLRHRIGQDRVGRDGQVVAVLFDASHGDDQDGPLSGGDLVDLAVGLPRPRRRMWIDRVDHGRDRHGEG
jgi:hypothetical protein